MYIYSFTIDGIVLVTQVIDSALLSDHKEITPAKQQTVDQRRWRCASLSIVFVENEDIDVVLLNVKRSCCIQRLTPVSL